MLSSAIEADARSAGITENNLLLPQDLNQAAGAATSDGASLLIKLQTDVF